MFHNCKSLESLDISNFDTRKVTTFYGMLYETGIKELNIGGENFKSDSMTQMYAMFNDKMTKITINNFDFKMNDASVDGFTWGRGAWLREEDGKIYSAVERAFDSSTMDISGTYTKVSNVTDLLSLKKNVNYKIIKYCGIELNDFETNLDNASFLIKDDGKQEFICLDIPLNSPNYSFDEGKYIKVILRDAVIDLNKNKYDLEIKLDNLYSNCSILWPSNLFGIE